MNHKVKIFFYFFLVFAVYTAVVVALQQRRERQYRLEHTLERMERYAAVVEYDVEASDLPSDLRITLMGPQGRVSFDNRADTASKKLDNHFFRTEVQQANLYGSGYEVRRSQTTGQKYLYYAKRVPEGFVRVALPYTSSTRSMVEANAEFLWWALGLFVVAMFFLWLVARRLGSNMARLDRAVHKNKAKSEQIKAEMTSSIAHELRTPVAAIRGYAETLLSDDLSADERRKFTERTFQASVRLSELIRDVSLLSKLDERGEGFARERVDLHALAAEAIEEQAAAAAEGSVAVKNLLPEGLSVEGSAALLRSVFSNLIENSIRYGGKWITVSVELVEDTAREVRLRVVDTGVGVPEGHLKHIFRRFYRVEGGRARADGGSGLGLAIVRHVVMVHGGDIIARTREGGGLVVEFTLKK